MTPQELKASILSLAVQGKLVKQCADEGSAIELLEQIGEKKDKFFASGIIKREKPLPAITDDELPYDIPDTWAWIRLGDYCQKVTDQVASGSFASLRENVPSLKEPDYAIMVKTADFANGFTRNLTYTTKHGYDFLENSNLFGGELVLSNIGSIGKCFIVPNLDSKMTLAPNAVMVRLVSDELRDYLYYYILSPQGYQSLLSITSGTAMKKFNKTDLKKILLPVPPLAEQKRIVAKIEELLPYIDRYEKAWSKLEDFKKHFPVDMQKSILQMAIQGKLVPQLPEEGTGEELLKILHAEKDKIVKSGVLKGRKTKPLQKVSADDIPFEIPDTWCWIRLGNVAEIFGRIGFRGYTKNDIVPAGEGAITISPSNIRPNGKTDFSDCAYLSWEKYEESPEIKVLEGDILLVKTGSSYGKCGIVCDLPEKATINPQLAILKYVTCDVTYLDYALKSPMARCQFESFVIGTSIPTFSQEKLANLLLPLPPLAEQKRIVAKLEEILPLCDRLK